MTLDEMKNYLRVDIDDDDSMIQSFMDGADEYLANMGVLEPQKDTPLYDICKKMLVTHWYENRSLTVLGNVSREIEFALSSIVTQLKYCYPSGDVT